MIIECVGYIDFCSVIKCVFQHLRSHTPPVRVNVNLDRIYGDAMN